MSGKWSQEALHVKILRVVPASASNGQGFHLCLSLCDHLPVGNRSKTEDLWISRYARRTQFMIKQQIYIFKNLYLKKMPTPFFVYHEVFIYQKAKALQHLKLTRATNCLLPFGHHKRLSPLDFASKGLTCSTGRILFLPGEGTSA